MHRSLSPVSIFEQVGLNSQHVSSIAPANAAPLARVKLFESGDLSAALESNGKIHYSLPTPDFLGTELSGELSTNSVDLNLAAEGIMKQQELETRCGRLITRAWSLRGGITPARPRLTSVSELTEKRPGLVADCNDNIKLNRMVRKRTESRLASPSSDGEIVAR